VVKSDQGGHPARPGGLVTDGTYVLQPIGWVESPLVGKNAAPKQGVEGSPVARLVFDGSMGGSATWRSAPRSSC
jgi:hypothetical protein